MIGAGYKHSPKSKQVRPVIGIYTSTYLSEAYLEYEKKIMIRTGYKWSPKRDLLLITADLLSISNIKTLKHFFTVQITLFSTEENDGQSKNSVTAYWLVHVVLQHM